MTFLAIIERLAVAIGCIALAALVATITISVAGRYFFGMPVPDDLVISEFLMVFVVFLPLAAVQAKREHVFVSLFTEWMSEKGKAVLDVIGVLTGFIVFCVIAAAVFTDFYSAWSFGAYADGPLQLPESPARFAVFFGIALLAVRLLADLVATIRRIRSGRIETTNSEEARVIERLD